MEAEPTEKWRIDPYRVLFPIAWCLGILGVALWVVFYLTGAIFYPGIAHANIMMGGFQFCFAAGFLMTAIPRFTGTESASVPELVIALFLGSLFFAISVIAAVDPGVTFIQSWVSFAFAVFLAIYFFRRFKRREHSPPPSFAFVATAIVYAIFGNLALALSDHLSVQPVILGRLLFYHGMMLALVLGVGSRLVTANLGWMQGPIIQIMRQTRSVRPFEFLRNSYGMSWMLALLFTASFLIEAFWEPQIGRLLRLVVVAWVILPVWKLFRLPKVKTKMAFCLWVSAWFVLLGCAAYAVGSQPVIIGGAHLMFIGGFSLMIFMIASRVTLSHGGFGLEFEAQSRSYAVVGSLTALAAVTRLTANLVSPTALPYCIVLAALLLLLALAVWGSTFISKVLRPYRLRHPRQAA